jgi:pilus assembly protein CpaE
MTGATNPEHTLRLPALPIATQGRRQEPREPVSRQRQSAPVSAEREHATMKFIGLMAIVFVIVAIIWQLGLWGVTAAYTSYAADEAAHTASAGGTSAEVRDDALRSVPSWFRTNIDVSQTDLGTVKATSSMPVLTPVFTVDGLDLTSEAPIVSEGS